MLQYNYLPHQSLTVRNKFDQVTPAQEYMKGWELYKPVYIQVEMCSEAKKDLEGYLMGLFIINKVNAVGIF